MLVSNVTLTEMMDRATQITINWQHSANVYYPKVPVKVLVVYSEADKLN